MSSRFVQPFFDAGAGLKPADGAQLFFFASDQVTPKDTYSDQLSTPTANANPVIADANGLFGDIFITGTYYVVLKDKNNVQKWVGDPVTEAAEVTGANFDKNFATLAAAVADTGLVDGDSINLKERTTGNGGGAFWDVVLSSTVTENTFNIVQCVGVGTLSLVLRNIGGIASDLQWGVIQASSYVFADAQTNRACYENMLRNTAYNEFVFEPKPNPTFIWGSVNVGRNDLTIRHLAGCDIRGRYSDPSEGASGQAGHMFGFVNYTDPYPGTDYSVAGTVERINYVLDGVASTIFDAGHTQLHNNNVIGFFDHVDCSVVGTGGVGASDHNGVGFDGLGINSKLDLAYIKDYDDRAVTMKGTSGTVDSASIKIGKLSGATRNGTVSESILVQDLEYASVTVGDAVLNLASLGTFVNSINCGLVDINFGYLENAVFAVALSETGQVNLNGGRYKNVTYLARRGGTAPATVPQKKISIKGVECVDSLTSTVYISQISANEGLWDEFEVVDCDFSAASGTFTPYAALLSASQPTIYNFRNNKAPSTITGTHDGAGNAAVLTDTTAAWTTGEHVGKTLNNTTDGSTTTVTANTATTITGVLAGGTDDDWDVSDAYEIESGWVYNSNIFNEQLNRPNTAVGGSSFVYDIAGTNGDSPYKEVSIIMTHSSDSSRYPLVINLQDILLTGANYRQSAVADDGSIMEITTTRTGTAVTFTYTTTAGTGTISSYSLSN